MKGFFQGNVPTLRPAGGLIARCGQCGLFKTCNSPKMPLAGEGRRKILVIGESPGKSEDEQGKPFIGRSGQLLQEKLRVYGADLYRDCWITNSIICHPPGDNFKTEEWVVHCRPNVVKAIKDTNPETIILLGGKAIKSVLGWLWKEDTEGAYRWAGFRIPCQRLNAWICPNWHPSYLFKRQGDREDNPVLEMLFDRYLAAALALRGRPWQTVPDYRKQVEVVLDPSAAGNVLRQMVRRGGRVAWDLETTGLKPDNPDIQIYSCAVCWEGKKTIAYPWHGDAVTATRELLASERVKKIGWNAKFEERHVLAKLGMPVINWLWDGMLAQHTMDNRQGTAGLKFQAFVRLGQEEYDGNVKQYLASSGTNVPNRIRDANLQQVLLYNSLDALLEFLIAEQQMREMGYGG